MRQRSSRAAPAAAAAIFACIYAAAPAAAQISFAQPTTFPLGGESSEIVAGDWNRDGLIDIATANSSSRTASTVLGDGTGNFLPPTTHAVGGTPSDIAAGDFDADGNLDLVVATQSSSGAVVMFGSASGTFSAPASVAVGGSPFKVATWDLNADGRDDIVTTNNAPGGPNVTVTPASLSGGFGAPASYNVTSPPADVAVGGDFNHDLRADIVTADGSSQMVSVLLWNPDGSFGPAKSVALPRRARSLAIADFNLDKAADVAVTMIPPSLAIMLSNGDGTFGPQVSVTSSSAQDVVTADFDRDRLLDLALVGGGAATLKGDGAGAFAAPVAQPPPGGAAAAVAEVDGDAMPDIVVARGSTGVVMPNISGGGAGPLPPPVVARTANVAPVTGTVLVKQPGKRSFIRLTAANQIPIGSQLDTTKGSVRLTSAAGGGKTQSGVFRGGLFKLGQKKAARPITELRLAAKLRCVKSRKPVHAGAKRPRTRRLFGNAHGSFRTRGRDSTATVRGTKWLVKDTCTSTLTVSQRGTVVVRDLVKHRTVTLRSGQRYLARRGSP